PITTLEGWPPHPIASPRAALIVFLFKSLLGLLFSVCGCRPLAGADRLFVAILRAQQCPDKSTELSGNGHFGFVALEAAPQQFHKAQMQPVLTFPGESTDRVGLGFLEA